MIIVCRSFHSIICHFIAANSELCVSAATCWWYKVKHYFPALQPWLKPSRFHSSLAAAIWRTTTGTSWKGCVFNQFLFINRRVFLLKTSSWQLFSFSGYLVPGPICSCVSRARPTTACCFGEEAAHWGPTVTSCLWGCRTALFFSGKDRWLELPTVP